MSWPDLLASLVRGENQPADATRWAMGQILTGSATPVQIAAFAVAMRCKGETVEEITGLADMMIEFATPIAVPGPAVDVVGSGGDRANTVNISTMAAVVAASAGVTVVKHGNRAASSACGAADVLEALGVVLELSPAQQERVIAEVGIGFLFAKSYHPALRHAAGARSELGIPTTFNFLGPLTNPAQPIAQAVGVADARMAALMAGVFAARGKQGVVAHGRDGLDELTTTAPSQVWIVHNGSVTADELDPADLGLPRAQISDLVGGPPPENARAVQQLVAGKPGAVHDIVVLNAAAALLAAAGPTDAPVAVQLRPHLEAARAAIASGAAAATLERWIAASRAYAGR